MAGVLALAILVSGWVVVGVSGQSTQLAPFTRDVNSQLFWELLDAISTTLDSIEQAMSQDASHDSPALATGPQGMGECDDTSTDAVDEGDAGRVRVDCTNRALRVAPTAVVTGGADVVTRNSAGTTEDEHAVCTGPCTVYSITATNHNAAIAFLRCENDTAANTTPGSETVELDLAIPGSATGAGITFSFPVGATFSTALTCWVVTGEADTDVAEVAANDVKLLYTRKQ
jgi:hypothetical protein